VCCLLKVTPRAPTIPSTLKPAILYDDTTMLLHYYSCSYTEAVVGNWDEEAIQALRRATRAGVTRGELGGEPQSSSSSLEATSDGAAELSEGGEGGHASNSSGQEPSEVARD